MNEEIKILFEDERIRVEEIKSFGVHSQANFWYDNDWDEWVRVVRGSAILELENELIALNSSECFYIKAHQKHRVAFTSSDCEWLCIYIKA